MKPCAHTPKLVYCIAPDGEYKIEGRAYRPFRNTAAAWQHVSDMGSRWIFYPIAVVTSIKGIIADGMSKEWIGRRITTLIKTIAADAEHVADYCDRKCPFGLYP